MKSKFSFTASLLLLTASIEQAVAGPTIADKRYWPSEVGPWAYQEKGKAGYARQIRNKRAGAASQPAASRKSCTYQGGPKSNLWTCR